MVAVAVLLPRGNGVSGQQSPDPAVAAVAPDPSPVPSVAELPMSANAPDGSGVPATAAPSDPPKATPKPPPPITTVGLPPTGSSGSIANAPPAPPSTSVEPEDLTGYKWPLRRARMTSSSADAAVPRDSPVHGTKRTILRRRSSSSAVRPAIWYSQARARL